MRDEPELDDIVNNILTDISNIDYEHITSNFTSALAVRQADTIDEAKYMAKKILKDNHNIESEIYLFNDIPTVLKKFNEEIVFDKMVNENYVHLPNEGLHLFQMRGKKSIQKVTGYPENDKRAIGFMSIKKDELTEPEKNFFSLYAKSLALAVHHGIQTDHFIDQKKFLNDITSFIVHEIGNPVNTLYMARQVMEMYEMTEEVQLEQMKYMIPTIDKLMDAFEICHIREISPTRFKRLSSKDPINLSEFCENAMTEFVTEVNNKGKNRTFLLSTDKNLLSKYCTLPKPYVHSLVSNVLKNAHKYTPDEGVMLMHFYEDKGDIVLNSMNTSLPVENHKNLSKEINMYERFSDVNETGFGLDMGIGLYFIKTIIEKGCLGKCTKEFGDKIDISSFLDTNKNSVSVHGKYNPSTILTPYFNLEIRVPKQNFIIE